MPISYLSTSHAHGTSDPGRRVDVYNKLLDVYLSATAGLTGGASANIFGELLARDYPVWHRRFRDDIPSPYVGIKGFLRWLCPTPLCPICDKPIHNLDIRRTCCSKECSTVLSTGVKYPMQDPRVVAKSKTTLSRNFGELGMAHPTIRARRAATCLETYGVDNPNKSEVVKLAKIKTNLSRRGVENPSQDILVKNSKEATSYAHYGVSNPFQAEEVKQTICATNMKTRGVPHSMQDPRVIETWQKRYKSKHGVVHHMQRPQIFAKVMRSSHRVKQYTYAGRAFEAQSSYEASMFGVLSDKYGIDNVLSQFDVGFPDYSFQEMGTFPDLYVSSLDLFVEVKSVYTLLGTDTQETLQQNQKKAVNAYLSGNKLRWVVLLDPKSRDYRILPRRWYRWNRKELEDFLNE